MRPPSLKRSIGFASIGGSLALAVALSACGDDGGTTQPTIIIQPSTFSTIVSTTAPAAAAGGGGAAAGGTVAGTQVYEVQSGDFLGAIADDFGIPPESIANFNQWDEGVNHMLHPGDVVNIPPGAEAPSAEDEDADEDEDEDSDSGSDEDSDTTEEEEDAEQEEVDPDDPPRCPDGSRQGTYTIEAGDIPAQVAESLDVTVDQLNEANANTPGYGGFIVGVDILVPCGEE
jgi:LysM repeat protein